MNLRPASDLHVRFCNSCAKAAVGLQGTHGGFVRNSVIGATLREIFALADAEEIPSNEAADRLAERRLESGLKTAPLAAAE